MAIFHRQPQRQMKTETQSQTDMETQADKYTDTESDKQTLKAVGACVRHI